MSVPHPHGKTHMAYDLTLCMVAPTCRLLPAHGSSGGKSGKKPVAHCLPFPLPACALNRAQQSTLYTLSATGWAVAQTIKSIGRQREGLAMHNRQCQQTAADFALPFRLCCNHGKQCTSPEVGVTCISHPVPATQFTVTHVKLGGTAQQ